MKGLYNGCTVSIQGSVIPGARSLASIPVELSKRARQRLKWFDYYHSHHNNARLTCRYLGISPQTFYRWKQRFDPRHLVSSLINSFNHLAAFARICSAVFVHTRGFAPSFHRARKALIAGMRWATLSKLPLRIEVGSFSI